MLSYYFMVAFETELKVKTTLARLITALSSRHFNSGSGILSVLQTQKTTASPVTLRNITAGPRIALKEKKVLNTNL